MRLRRRGDDGAGKDPKERTGTLTVRLMRDARTSRPEPVCPGGKVRYQQWGASETLLPPRAVSSLLTYVVGGAFEGIDPAECDNSGTWIKGLKDTCSVDGKLYRVPCLAGARVGINRSGMLEDAGFDRPPAGDAQLIEARDRLQAKYGLGRVMAQDKTAILYTNGWEAGGVSDPEQGGRAGLEGQGRRVRQQQADADRVDGLVHHQPRHRPRGHDPVRHPPRSPSWSCSSSCSAGRPRGSPAQ